MRVKVLNLSKGLKVNGHLPLTILSGEERFNVFLKFLIFDFSKFFLGNSGHFAHTINPDGTIAPSPFARELKKVIHFLLDEKKRLETQDLRIRLHFFVYPDTPEYRHLVLGISLLTRDPKYLLEPVQAFRRYCTYSIQSQRLQKIISLVNSVDTAQLPYFSIRMTDVFKLVPSHCVKKMSIFELTSLFEKLPIGAPLHRLESTPITDGFRFAKDSLGNEIVVPPVKKILLRGGDDSLHFPLIESSLLPQNHLIMTKNVFLFKSYAEENPDIAIARNLSFISAKNCGINLLKLMKQDPIFAIRVFRSWLLLIDFHPSLFDTAFHLIENLRTQPFEQVNSFYDLLKFKFNVLNEISIVESNLDRFLLAFEEILSLPFFSNDNDEDFKSGGLKILDCSSIKNPVHVLAIGMVLHQLRVSRYHNYSLSIPGWNHLKSGQFAFHNLKPYFANLHFHSYFTVFASSTEFTPLSEMCDLIVENYPSFLKNNSFSNHIFSNKMDDIVCTIVGSSSFIYGSPNLSWLSEPRNENVHWDLSSRSYEEEEPPELEVDDLDPTSYQEFERDYFKWVICYELWLSSPLTLEEIMDKIQLLPISSSTTEDILNELVEEGKILHDGNFLYSLANSVRIHLMAIEKDHLEISAITLEEIGRQKTEYGQMNYLRKQVSRITSTLDIRNLANDIYLLCKGNSRLRKYSGFFFSFLVEFGYNRTKLDSKAIEIVKQLLRENIENVSNSLSDDDVETIREFADEEPYHERGLEGFDLDALENANLNVSPSPEDVLEIPNEMEENPKAPSPEVEDKGEQIVLEGSTDPEKKRALVKAGYKHVNLNIVSYRPIENPKEGFQDLVERVIQLPVLTASFLELHDFQEDPDEIVNYGQDQEKKKEAIEEEKIDSCETEPNSKVISIPQPPSPAKQLSTIKKPRIPLTLPVSDTNENRKFSEEELGNAYNSLDLFISKDVIKRLDFLIDDFSNKPLEEVMIQLFNDFLIYPITEKRFYSSLPEIIEVLSEVSHTCNISIQDFTNELAQNIGYWKRFDQPEQREEIMKQILEKFKSALKQFKYSHAFREKLRERIIGNPANL